MINDIGFLQVKDVIFHSTVLKWWWRWDLIRMAMKMVMIMWSYCRQLPQVVILYFLRWHLIWWLLQWLEIGWQWRRWCDLTADRVGEISDLITQSFSDFNGRSFRWVGGWEKIAYHRHLNHHHLLHYQTNHQHQHCCSTTPPQGSWQTYGGRTPISCTAGRSSFFIPCSEANICLR